MEEQEIRESFVFYKSFKEAIESLEDDKNKLLSYRTIIEYGLTGKEPNVTGVAKTIYLLVKPQIDVNRKRYINGKKGGRPRTKENTNNNQNETKPKPNVNDNVYDNYTEYGNF